MPTPSPDWQALFKKYIQAVVDDDYIIGLRCLESYGGWSSEEKEIMIQFHKEFWPEDFLGPWTEEEYDKYSKTKNELVQN